MDNDIRDVDTDQEKFWVCGMGMEEKTYKGRGDRNSSSSEEWRNQAHVILKTFQYVDIQALRIIARIIAESFLTVGKLHIRTAIECVSLITELLV